MADSIAFVIFLIILLPFLSIFEVRTYMEYVFEKSLAEMPTTQVIKKHAIFSEILYLYPWKYIKKHKMMFFLFQMMYFSCIGSIILTIKTLISNYLQEQDFWKAIGYNNVAIAALPMMLCILAIPVVSFIFRQCWKNNKEAIDTKRITKLYHQYMHQKTLLQQQNLDHTLSKRKIQRILYDMTATLVYIISQMDPETHILHSTREVLDKRLQCIDFVIKEFEYIEAQIEKEQITKDLNWTTFTIYHYPFTHRYYRAREKYFSKSPDDRDFEFDNMQLIVSDFFNQIINAQHSYEAISYNPVEYLQKPTHIFFNLLNDFQQRCYEQEIENTQEILAYYHSELDNTHVQE